MVNNSYKRIFSGSVWGIISKTIDSIIKIFTIPLLIGYYGKSDFGLIALAFSLNTYLRLTELGMNTGAIKFFSQWFAQKNIDKITGLSQSSIIFYGILGLFNGIIVILIGQFSDSIFQLTKHQADIFNWFCIILGFSALFHWLTFVFNQLLTAYEDFAWLRQVEIFRSILNLGSVAAAIFFDLSLPAYFLLFTLTNLVILPLTFIRLKIVNIPLNKLLKPKWNRLIFYEVLTYSLSIFALSLFQYTANYLRPVLLGIFDSNGVDSVADFRILQSITQLIIAIGTIFMGVLLPISSKKFALNEIEKNSVLIYDGTRYVTVLLAYIVSLIILNSSELLTLYVGKSFAGLTTWLQIWALTILLYLHNSPIASLVLASGKTKMLVFSAAFGTIISVLFIILTADILKVGSAVYGFLLYIIVQMSFYYGFYNRRIFHLDSIGLFLKSFLKPTIVTLTPVVLIIILFNYYFLNFTSIQSIISKTVLFHLLYLPLLLNFVIKIDEFRLLIKRITK